MLIQLIAFSFPLFDLLKWRFPLFPLLKINLWETPPFLYDFYNFIRKFSFMLISWASSAPFVPHPWCWNSRISRRMHATHRNMRKCVIGYLSNVFSLTSSSLSLLMMKFDFWLFLCSKIIFVDYGSLVCLRAAQNKFPSVSRHFPMLPYTQLPLLQVFHGFWSMLRVEFPCQAS